MHGGLFFIGVLRGRNRVFNLERPIMKDLRERCEKLYNALPSELGRYKRHVDVIDQIEAFAREIRQEALEECADIVANAGYASRSVRGMFYDPIQELIEATLALAVEGKTK